MSQANVEIIRDAFGSSDGHRLVRILDPEIEWYTRADLPDSDVHRGHKGVTAFMLEWLGSFEGLHTEVGDCIDRGDRVVVPLVLRGRVRGSRAEVAMPETWVFKLRDGLVVEVREYQALDKALRAVGLEE